MRTLAALAVLTLHAAQPAPEAAPKDRARAVKALERDGARAIPQMEAYLGDVSPEVRQQAVRALAAVGTVRSLGPLAKAIYDDDDAVTLLAIDAAVNFYLPGYYQDGWGARLKSAASVTGLKLNDRTGYVVEPDVVVRREVEEALAAAVESARPMVVRASAARAAGALRAKLALPRLIAALRVKDDAVIFESLIAIQKIGDVSAGPKVIFLLRDITDRIQFAALETVGILKTAEAVPELMRLLSTGKDAKERRRVLESLALIGDPSSRGAFEPYTSDKDDAIRAAAWEGLGRAAGASLREKFTAAYDAEKKMAPRLALAFACAGAGELSLIPLRPLRYLIDTLNSKIWQGVAQAYLSELARRRDVRDALSSALDASPKEERISLLRILGATAGREIIPRLEALAKDGDPEVAQESLRSLRLIRTRGN